MKKNSNKGAIAGVTVASNTTNRRSDLISEVVEHARDALWVIDAQEDGSFAVRYANAAFERIYERPRADVDGADVITLLTSRAPADDVEYAFAKLRLGTPFALTRLQHRRDGQPMWLQIDFQPTTAGDASRWIVVSRDVTEFVIAQRRNEQFAQAIELLAEPVVIVAANEEQWSIDYANRAFVGLLGYNPSELHGRALGEFLSSKAEAKLAEDARAGLFSGQRINVDLPFTRKDGSEALLRLAGTPIGRGRETLYDAAAIVFHDITDMRKNEERLREQATRDPLTGLYNRREFERRLRTAISMASPRGPRHVLLFIDLDHFKAVNDGFGHDAGDDVLITVANILRARVLPSDEVGRWGGDEFSVILYFYDMGNAISCAQSIIDALSDSPDARGVGASIGAVPITAGSTAEELLRAVDQLVYEAKASGRNRVVTLQ